MTRRRLWSLTGLACALLTVPSVPRISLARLHLAGVHLPVLDAPRLPSPAVLAAALLLLTLATVILVRRGRRTASEYAVALARRGHPVPAIARRTRLSQDAVRDLLGGDPAAVSTARMGRFFRSRKAATPVGTGSFADELSERSFDAKA
jgi:hypothetical protein